MSFQIDPKTKRWLQRLDHEREFAIAFLQLYETNRLTLQTFTPMYMQLKNRQQQMGYRWDSFYVYMEKAYAQLKYNLNGTAPVRNFALDEVAIGESCFEHTAGPERRYGHVKLQLVRDPAAEHTRFEWSVAPSSSPSKTIPAAFAPVIYEAIATQLAQFAQSGLRLVGAKAVVCGGSFHPIDSEALSYKVAATQALNVAINDARLLIV